MHIYVLFLKQLEQTSLSRPTEDLGIDSILFYIFTPLQVHLFSASKHFSKLYTGLFEANLVYCKQCLLNLSLSGRLDIEIMRIRIFFHKIGFL